MVVWDPATSSAAYEITVTGLDFAPALGVTPRTETTDDDVRNMHVHNAARAVAGAVVFGQIGPAQDADDISFTENDDGSWTIRGVWEPSDPAGTSILEFADDLTSAAAGSEVALYFNIHTPPFPAGEIRAQWVASAGEVITAEPGQPLVASGGDDPDSLTGGDLADILSGGGGDDTVNGNAGDDILLGDDGNDTINTGAGNDVVLGGDGNDSVGGMAGADTVLGGQGDDLVVWNDPVGDLVFGDDGKDTLRGGDVAADTIHGGDGDDLIRAVANQGLETHASDLLFGDDGNDAVLGGNAADTIEGGAGDDTVAGFGGADEFVQRADEAGKDVIFDFDNAGDVLVLVGFASDFDPLDRLSQEAFGTVLDLGEAGEVSFFGRLVNEFGAEDFILRA
jgi:Ca2+-binding RTX toxin-like protein